MTETVDYSKCDEIPGADEKNLEQQMIDHQDKSTGGNIEKMPINRPGVLQSLHDNEDGDVFLFIELYQDKYLYDHAARCWYYWNDHYWRFEELKHIFIKLNDVIQLYMEQQTYELWSKEKAKKKGQQDIAKRHQVIADALAKRIRSLKTKHRKQNIVSMSTWGVNSLGYHGNEWDTNPWLLGCKNGVINLETGKRRDGRPDDYIKVVSPVKWIDEYQDCPTWKKFLLDIMGQDQEMVGYLKRLFGYGITGLTTENIYPILHGDNGQNGKTTMLETLSYILGEEMTLKIPATFFIEQARGKKSGGPDAELMAFRGARIVWGSETNKGDRLDVSKIKEMSGGDTISARPPWGKRIVQFRPTHLMFLLTNKLPKAPADDPALWKRLHIIKFLYSYVSDPDPNNPFQKKKDPDLREKLFKEAPAIFRWLVEGCLEWQEFGLLPPEQVIKTTLDYQKSEDILGHFVDESCILGDPNDITYRVKPKDLYQAYKEWCDDVGHRHMAKKHFLEDMRRRFEIKTTRGIRKFVGITISQFL